MGEGIVIALPGGEGEDGFGEREEGEEGEEVREYRTHGWDSRLSSQVNEVVEEGDTRLGRSTQTKTRAEALLKC